MIYGKIWCVVKPSVGIPLFLGAVAVSSFAVHFMILSNTTWLPKFLGGKAAATTAAAAQAQLPTLVAALPEQKQ
jgi:light-harvesting protein B-800-850 alpha chain